jgi:hypothetical protein
VQSGIDKETSRCRVHNRVRDLAPRADEMDADQSRVDAADRHVLWLQLCAAKQFVTDSAPPRQGLRPAFTVCMRFPRTWKQVAKSITGSFEDRSDSGQIGVGDGFRAQLGCLLLCVIVRRALNLALCLELPDKGRVFPAHLTGEVTQACPLGGGAQVGNGQSVRDQKLLGLSVRWRDALVELDARHSSLAALSLPGQHAADGLKNDLRRRAEMVWAVLRVGVRALLQVCLEVRAVARAATRDGHLLAADDDDLLTVQSLLREDGGQAAHQMAAPVDDNGTGKHCDACGAGTRTTAGLDAAMVRKSFLDQECSQRRFGQDRPTGRRGCDPILRVVEMDMIQRRLIGFTVRPD